jgi:hypothetical protein
MKLTQEKLNKIIKEELKRSIGEGFGDQYAGETHRTAQAFDQQAIEQLAMEFKQLLDSSQAVKNIQPPRDGSIMQALQMAMGGMMQESKKRDK